MSIRRFPRNLPAIPVSLGRRAAHVREVFAHGAAMPALLFVVASAEGCERSVLSDGLPETMNCSTCHGGAENPAPPGALDGSYDTDDLAVGAHQHHLLAGRISEAVPCTECHRLPADLLTHPDPAGGGAQLIFGPFASLAGAQPAWERATGRCSNTYCHGATLPEAETRPAPLWTRVDGSERACDSCHGDPPGGAHPPSDACEACHGAVVAAGHVIVDLALHIDGKVDMNMGPSSEGAAQVTVHPAGYAAAELHGVDMNLGVTDCRACHGMSLEGASGAPGCDPCHQAGWRSNCTYCHGGELEASGAPPGGLNPAASNASLGVGAHTVHVTETSHPAYACSECHAPVTDVLSDGHIFDATPGRAEVDFQRGRSPAGQYASPGCSNLYCHGDGSVDGAVATFLPSRSLDCESCHPASSRSSGHGSHASLPCESCHPDASGSAAISNPSLHVDGLVQVSMAAGAWHAETATCVGTSCHGAGDISW